MMSSSLPRVSTDSLESQRWSLKAALRPACTLSEKELDISSAFVNSLVLLPTLPRLTMLTRDGVKVLPVLTEATDMVE